MRAQQRYRGRIGRPKRDTWESTRPLRVYPTAFLVRVLSTCHHRCSRHPSPAFAPPPTEATCPFPCPFTYRRSITLNCARRPRERGKVDSTRITARMLSLGRLFQLHCSMSRWEDCGYGPSDEDENGAMCRQVPIIRSDGQLNLTRTPCIRPVDHSYSPPLDLASSC